MKKVVTLDSFEAFQQRLRLHHDRKSSDVMPQLILIFMANDDPETNESWCPDCAQAKPIIDEVSRDSDDCELAYVLVGARDEWKSSNNPYRLHELKVNNVPTVINMESKARLVESECFDRERLRNLFTGTK